MVRNVVYPSRLQARMSDKVAGVAADAEDQQQPDDYGDKLVKYIPAEVIAFFLPAYALAAKLNNFSDRIGWLLVGIAVLGTVGYLLVKADKTKPPRWYFYLLAVLAFLGWAIGTTTEVAELFNLPQPELSGKLVVFVTVFFVPLVDGLLTRYLPQPAAPTQ
jgi:uncharacterized membrane protein AbrB (regulator of aidB expression)